MQIKTDKLRLKISKNRSEEEEYIIARKGKPQEAQCIYKRVLTKFTLKET